MHPKGALGTSGLKIIWIIRTNTLKIYQKSLGGHTIGNVTLVSCNPDVSKQAQEVIFSRKQNINNPVVFVNNFLINRKSTQKHFGLLLDKKLDFSET